MFFFFVNNIMSTFRSAFNLASKVFGKKKTVRAVKRHLGRGKRKSQGPNGIVMKKFTTIEDKITCQNNLFAVGTETFELADMPQYADYVKLYEQFRIKKIVYKFRALVPVNQSIGAGDGISTLGYLHTVVDHNDAAAPTGSVAGIQAMMNDSAYKGVKSSRDLVRTIRPMFLTQAGTQTAKSTRGWLNCKDITGAVNAVSHYGIKWIVEGGIGTLVGNPYNVIYEPLITYYVEFKNPQ